MFPVILGRPDLRISLPRTKFDEEADFDVRLAVDPRKPRQTSETQILAIRFVCRIIFVLSKNETSGIARNTFWQSFARIRAKFDVQTDVQSFQNSRGK